jgi:hypothetical protein
MAAHRIGIMLAVRTCMLARRRCAASRTPITSHAVCDGRRGCGVLLRPVDDTSAQRVVSARATAAAAHTRGAVGRQPRPTPGRPACRRLPHSAALRSRGNFFQVEAIGWESPWTLQASGSSVMTAPTPLAGLSNFLVASPTPYQMCAHASKRLIAAGFTEVRPRCACTASRAPAAMPGCAVARQSAAC